MGFAYTEKNWRKLNPGAMTFRKFCDATQFVQKTVITFHGVLLLQRDIKGLHAELYQVDGFYVEILYRRNSLQISQVTGYADTNGIEDYLQLVNIREVEDLI
jgi:hypothetical protein